MRPRIFVFNFVLSRHRPARATCSLSHLVELETLQLPSLKTVLLRLSLSLFRSLISKTAELCIYSAHERVGSSSSHGAAAQLWQSKPWTMEPAGAQGVIYISIRIRRSVCAAELFFRISMEAVVSEPVYRWFWLLIVGRGHRSITDCWILMSISCISVTIGSAITNKIQ